jgi:ribonucleoside-diphosphate reductase alpha chain
MKKYTYQEVYNASLDYFDNDDLAAKVFVDKYALQDTDGKYDELTPLDMHKRLAKEFSRIENKYPNPMSEEEILNLFDKFKYIVPQGSPLNGINNPYQIQSVSNCFVLESPEDSYSGIMKTDQEEAHIMRRRGGVGFDISKIRPKGLSTNNAAKTTDGIGLFMQRFSNTCREVAQGNRRGALMLTIDVHHPEVLTFINIKKDLKKVTGANVSVRVSDEFMTAVKNKQEYELRWPVDSKEPKIRERVSAKLVWDELIQSAWESAEPGVLFWDTVQKYTPTDIYKDFGYESISTNPCGEIVLSKNDSCRLMVLNLESYVKNPFTENTEFDFKLFSEHVQKAQKLMDDLVDIEVECVDKILAKIESDPEPLEIKQIELNLWKKIREAGINGRRTGLGITALGDCLAALNIKYGSEDSIKMTEEIYKCLAVNAYRSSVNLAKERGAFPIFDLNLEKDHPFLKRIWNEDKNLFKDYVKYGKRNIALLTTAPTGSISTLTKTTSGIEPPFLLSYVRRKKINATDKEGRVDFIDDLGDKWQEFTVYHHGVKKWMDATGKKDIKESPYFGATSNDIDWLASVEIQSVAQKWIDHSISKTCNLPNNTTKELVSDIYLKAYESGCKGFTVYRDGCRSGVLVSEETHKKQNKNPNERPNEIEYCMAPKRPEKLPCEIKKVKINGEAWTIFVGLFDGKPYELFGGLSKYVEIPNKYKTGYIVKNGKVNDITTYNLIVGDGDDQMTIKDIANVFENPNYGAFTRTISLSLRHGVPLQYIVEQLSKDKYSDMISFSKVISRVFKSYIKDGTKVSSEKKCPNCFATNSLVYQEGCLKCNSCVYSKCG